MFDYKYSEKDLELKTESVEIVGSADLLTPMCANILDNAIKFSAHGNRIYVSIHAQDDKAVLQVIDHGCGMDKTTMEHIFDKFYQGDSSHSSEGFVLAFRW